MAALRFSDRAKQLILSAEGNIPPSRKPPGDSGVTIGYGYDLGYVTVAEFTADWMGRIPNAHFTRLLLAVGKRGDEALTVARTLAGIVIPDSTALAVFTERSLPTYYAQTLAAFPGLPELPLDAQGALVSLVYNRGGKMADSAHGPVPEDRREMREIRFIVMSNLPIPDKLRAISAQLLSMQRVWRGRKMDGLITRRANEAALVLSSLPPDGSEHT